MAAPPQLTRMHRILIGVVVSGALIIAGIGFAGSYAAVRELAIKKGFGNFSYVFPVGIDAGICVLLALDLLLTWIRIPFPLLRQTAWLLTAATIAFNGAAAWPDPLGVSMHAVIPILFVAAVEAARHAIGRIADISADKHMEGVRLTRWLLSPLPTFLLWRRMKLWELRSYDQVIKLEQERLVYQARLHSRFGRAWRRKAPVESLMPLRLARYGVPLTETAPAGLAAAGIGEPLTRSTLAQVSTSAQPQGGTSEFPGETEQEVPAPANAEASDRRPATAVPGRPIGQQTSSAGGAERFAKAYETFIGQPEITPPATQRALWLRKVSGIPTGAGAPLSEEQLQPLPEAPQNRNGPQADKKSAATRPPQSTDQSWPDYLHNARRSHEQEPDAFRYATALATHMCKRDTSTGDDGQPITSAAPADLAVGLPERGFRRSEPTAQDTTNTQKETEEPVPHKEAQQPTPGSAAAPVPAQATKAQRGPRVNTPIDQPLQQTTTGNITLTASDRYYLAWMKYQAQHGNEPSDQELSTHLAHMGLHGRGGKPISPANLRRHFLHWRVYNVWAEHRLHTDKPAPEHVAQACTDHGITAQYNRPITPEYITKESDTFEQRWHTLTG